MRKAKSISLVLGVRFFYDLYRSTFEKSELGRMKKLLPLHEVAENFGLTRKSMRPKLGVKSYERPIVRGKENGIPTSFVKRGRPFTEEKKEKDLVRKELARVRATAMVGSFGTQKEHYDLRRVKTRTKLTEILYIFFGIHTANVVQLEDRIEQRAQLAAS